MITLQNVSKVYPTRKGKRTILNNVNLQINKGQKVAILGRNGAGKSTLIRLISGIEHPTSGIITRKMSISWPIAFSGGFQGSLTGMDNLRFIARVYNVDILWVKQYVEEFAELGQYLYEPIKNYSSGMKARLAFALSLAIHFDCLLIDEVTAVGDARFNEKCRKALVEERKEDAMIFVSHNDKAIRQYCQNAYVLEQGQLHYFEDLDEASQFYQASMK